MLPGRKRRRVALSDNDAMQMMPLGDYQRSPVEEVVFKRVTLEPFRLNRHLRDWWWLSHDKVDRDCQVYPGKMKPMFGSVNREIVRR